MKKLITILMMALAIFAISCGNTDPIAKDTDPKYDTTKIKTDCLLTMSVGNNIVSDIGYAFLKSEFEPNTGAVIALFANGEVKVASFNTYFNDTATVDDLKTALATAFNDLTIVKDGIAKPIIANDILVANADGQPITDQEDIKTLLNAAEKAIIFGIPLEFEDNIKPSDTRPQVLTYTIVVTQ